MLNGAGPALEHALCQLDDLLKVSGSNGEKTRVKLSEQDSDLFQEIINNKDPDYASFCKKLKKRHRGNRKRIVESHALMIDNYAKLCDKAKSWIEDHAPLKKSIDDNDGEEFARAVHKLIDQIKNMAESNNFAFVVVTNKIYAHKIFTALNSLGVELDQADLIKSHLLNRAKSNSNIESNVNRKWAKIFDEELNKRDRFLYESISSRYPTGKVDNIKITQDNLYRIVDSIVRTPSDVQKWLNMLEEDAEFLKIMDYPDDLKEDQKDKINRYDKIKSDFYGIKVLNARHIRVPILAAYRKWNGYEDSRFQKLVDCLLIFFFRFKLISGGTAEDVRSIVNRVTRDIHDGKSISKIIYRILVNENVSGDPVKRLNDDKFKDEFKEKAYKMASNDARYVLGSIELFLRRQEESPYAYFDYNFELEHILPKHHTKYWDTKKFLNENVDDGINKYKDRLGNLTILSAAWNRGLASKGFNAKKDDDKGYSKSIFRINAYLKKLNEWTAREVSAREDHLADIAKNAWSLKAYNKDLKEEGYKDKK